MNKVVLESLRLKMIGICPLEPDITGMLQFPRSLMTSMWLQKGEFQGILFPEVFMREDCFPENLLFVSRSLLRIEESV